MIDCLRSLKSHTAYGQRLMAFLPSLLIAEFLYKFHSFTLECGAFLLTWLILDAVIEAIMGRPRCIPGVRA